MRREPGKAVRNMWNPKVALKYLQSLVAGQRGKRKTEFRIEPSRKLIRGILLDCEATWVVSSQQGEETEKGQKKKKGA